MSRKHDAVYRANSKYQCKKKETPPVGLEPTTFELEVQNASPLRHGGLFLPIFSFSTLFWQFCFHFPADDIVSGGVSNQYKERFFKGISQKETNNYLRIEIVSIKSMYVIPICLNLRSSWVLYKSED